MRRLQKYLIVIVFAMMLFISGGSCVSAAEVGTTVANPVKARMGVSYTKSWNKDTDHLYHYNKITVTSQGILKMTFSKPIDSEGEYGNLNIVVSNKNGEVIWENLTEEAQESASSNYVLYLGLKPGTYYVDVKPGFRVYSGNITTRYKFSFEKTKYIEVESNEGMYQATKLTLGNMYRAYLGGDGYSSYENSDYFKVYLAKGKTYRLLMSNYGKIDDNAEIDFIDPDGKDIFDDLNKMDNRGYKYYEFRAPLTGTYYLHLYNYYGKQIPYKVGVANVTVAKVRSIKTSARTTTSLTLSWSKPSGSVSGYEIYRASDDDSDYKLVKTIKGKNTIKFKNTRLESGETYYYKIRSYRVINGKKSYSSFKKIKTATRPARPINLELEYDRYDRCVSIDFDDRGDEDGYQIYYSTSKNGKYKRLATTTDTSYDKYNLSRGKRYYFKVRSYKKVNGVKIYSDFTPVRSIVVK